MRVSVVLCTYNGERFLGPQLESLLAQLRLPDEIVVQDDASSDGTWERLQAFAARARVRGVAVELQRNPANLGYVRNFERALQRARGDLVFLCDQDDVWHPEKIARMASRFLAEPELGLLHTDARLVDADGAWLGVDLLQALEVSPAELEMEHSGRAFDLLMRRNLVTGATTALRGALLGRLLPVPEGWVHDEWLAIAAATQARVDCMPWASIDYRQHGSNQIGARPRRLVERLAYGWVARRVSLERLCVLYRSFLQRIDEGGLAVEPEVREAVAQRLRHALARARLPRSPLRRLASVREELGSGRYARFSFGLRSAAGDLLGLRV
ncbi:glycosyltransferase family 2 protein [Pseudoxanthomonas taiwanensis]|uniref:Glycosyltransferase involved in cell wall biosynthesis n=1 Tax=Pseudoxanthomonas taiwanensis J19 TaxID=935569 RepID=A0A562DK59_9GAMM|nr:glycosyltransferase family 2 protein [Pseudoxanthomonas taiwanensis]TWH09937.1 glycosyltransferase involved in cell wall biosynthesis [Pseudoxanthomonas taiwanensis J19]